MRWRECVGWMAAQGVTRFYEIGAGKVLMGLARRIDRKLAVKGVQDPDALKKALASLES